QQQQPADVRLWDVTATEGGPALKERAVLKGHRAAVLTVAFSPDGKRLASGGGTYGQFGEVLVWDVAGAKQIQILAHREWIECLTFSPDGKTLVSGGGIKGSDGELRLWDMARLSVPRLLQGHNSYVGCAAVSPDGKVLVTGSGDNTIKLWDLETGAEL